MSIFRQVLLNTTRSRFVYMINVRRRHCCGRRLKCLCEGCRETVARIEKPNALLPFTKTAGVDDDRFVLDFFVNFSPKCEIYRVFLCCRLAKGTHNGAERCRCHGCTCTALPARHCPTFAVHYRVHVCNVATFAALSSAMYQQFGMYFFYTFGPMRD